MGKHDSKSERTNKDSGHKATHSRHEDNELNRTLNRLKDEAAQPIPGLGGDDRRTGSHER